MYCDCSTYDIYDGDTKMIVCSGVFRGHGAMPPLWPDHENFLQSTLYEKMRFLPFSSKSCKIQQCLMVFCISKFQKNGRICGFHWTLKNKKCFSFREALPPDPLPGALPLDPAGGSASRPSLKARALRSPCPPLPNPKYATGGSWFQ